LIKDFILMHIKGERLMRKTIIFVITILLVGMVSLQNANAASKTRSAISPYIQTDNDSTYTFVGITHPSLNTAATQIGLTVATVGLDGATPSSTFTINAGQTYRIFIVSTNHTTINSTTVTDDRVLFLSTTTGSSESGQLLITSSTFGPLVQSALADGINSNKYDNLNQLSMWGAIVIPSTSTGFAMEFIGDAHDSSTLMTSALANNGATTLQSIIEEGRGIN